MKTINRSRYIIYMEPWSVGRHVVVYSKFQMKKVLLKANSGSTGIKTRLIKSKDGSISFWNVDMDYDYWVKS
jgi:hypothetical protein